MSALEVSVLLRQETWIGLLNRPSLSCFHHIYGLSMTLSEDRREVLVDVLDELISFLCVASFARERLGEGVAGGYRRIR